VAWMGFDEPRSLGAREFGATVALPIWIDFMRSSLAGQPAHHLPQPAGVVYAQGDWMYETFQNQGAVWRLDLDPLQWLKDLFGA